MLRGSLYGSIVGYIGDINNEEHDELAEQGYGYPIQLEKVAWNSPLNVIYMVLMV